MANASDAVNFVAVEAKIVERLTELLMTGEDACVKRVLTAPELADIPEERQTVPAVYVVYAGPAVTAGSSGDASVQAVYQHRWVVSVAVGSSARMRESHARHSEAGPILQRVAEALHGWKPLAGFSRMAPYTPPAVAYDTGYAYFPMGWSTKATAAVTIR